MNDVSEMDYLLGTELKSHDENWYILYDDWAISFKMITENKRTVPNYRPKKIIRSL